MPFRLAQLPETSWKIFKKLIIYYSVFHLSEHTEVNWQVFKTYLKILLGLTFFLKSV